MSECTHDCSTCGESCSERTSPQDLQVPVNGLSHVGKVIAVVSGKGGVGKSLVTSSLAVAMRRLGKTVGVLDADITGPSIPKAFGVKEKAYAAAENLLTIKKQFEADPKGKTPAVLCVLCGMANAAYQRPDGVFVVPVTAMKP